MHHDTTNSGHDFLLAAAILLGGLFLAGYGAKLLRKKLNAHFIAGRLKDKSGKELRYLPALLQCFVIINALILAEDRLDFAAETQVVLDRLGQGLFWTGNLILLLFLAIILRRGLAVGNSQPAKTADADGALAQEPVEVAFGDPDALMITAIVRLFTDIVKRHLGAGPDAPGRSVVIEQDPGRAKYVVDLQVEVNGSWKSRRMTVGRIGADSGSRSKCFFVIYDEYLVLKVPPQPVIDLKEYIEGLKAEAVLAKQLATPVCIIPTVSTILKYVDKSIVEKVGGIDSSEELACKSLLVTPQLSRYLKLGETFVYFMDMSKYYFLQDVVKYLHDSSPLVAEEVLKHATSGWGFFPQAARYGQEAAPLFQAMEKGCANFEEEILKILATDDRAGKKQHQIRKFLASRLVEDISPDFAQDLPPAQVDRINKFTDRFLQANRELIKRYHQTIMQATEGLRQARAMAPIEGMIANLLDLLAHIGDRGVALRDLKPDNLLVAGDRQHFPGFLSRPETYEIGLIDIETAVIYGNPPRYHIAQPQLGGTPQYATPSHFFYNDLLVQLYGEVGLVLHLQDWYGMIAVIYKVISNRFLFKKTALVVPALVRKVNASKKVGEDLLPVAIMTSRVFWREAEKEFNEKLRGDQVRLKRLEIRLSPAVAEMFRARLTATSQQVQDKIKNAMAGQNVYTTDKHRSVLTAASAAEIVSMLKKWQNVSEKQPDLLPHKTPMLNFLARLAILKGYGENLTQMLVWLRESEPKVTAYLLLQNMFAVIKNQMVVDSWADSPAKAQEEALSGPLDSGASLEATCREFQTIIQD